MREEECSRVRVQDLPPSPSPADLGGDAWPPSQQQSCSGSCCCCWPAALRPPEETATAHGWRPGAGGGYREQGWAEEDSPGTEWGRAQAALLLGNRDTNQEVMRQLLISGPRRSKTERDTRSRGPRSMVVSELSFSLICSVFIFCFV